MCSGRRCACSCVTGSEIWHLSAWTEPSGVFMGSFGEGRICQQSWSLQEGSCCDLGSHRGRSSPSQDRDHSWDVSEFPFSLV